MKKVADILPGGNWGQRQDREPAEVAAALPHRQGVGNTDDAPGVHLAGALNRRLYRGTFTATELGQLVDPGPPRRPFSAGICSSTPQNSLHSAALVD